MNAKPIDSFFPPICTISSSTTTTTSVTTTTSSVEEAAKKRPHSDGSQTTSTSSPAAKSTRIFSIDGEDDVFSVPDDSPAWVPLMFKAFDKMTQRMVDLFCKVDDFSNNFVSFKAEVKQEIAELKSDVNTKVGDLEKTVEFVSTTFDDQEERITNLEKQLKAAVNAQEEATDALEQYSRRNCLLLHGVPETAKEDTDTIFRDAIKEHLGKDLKLRDLDRTHRIGAKREDGRGRPIIAKFTRYITRASVFREKKKLKGTKFVITESLTKRRVTQLNAARDKYGKDNVWTSDGEILVQTEDKKIKNVRNI